MTRSLTSFPVWFQEVNLIPADPPCKIGESKQLGQTTAPIWEEKDMSVNAAQSQSKYMSSVGLLP